MRQDRGLFFGAECCVAVKRQGADSLGPAQRKLGGDGGAGVLAAHCDPSESQRIQRVRQRRRQVGHAPYMTRQWLRQAEARRVQRQHRMAAGQEGEQGFHRHRRLRGLVQQDNRRSRPGTPVVHCPAIHDDEMPGYRRRAAVQFHSRRLRFTLAQHSLTGA